MDLKFRTKAACRIADYDHQRFNEDVAAGEYQCAPTTTSGIARVFDECDIAGLYVYSFLMRVYAPLRFTKKIAAMYACEIILALRRNAHAPDDVKLRADFSLGGFNDSWTVRRSDEPVNFSGSLGMVSFDLNLLLSVVRSRMEEEAKILGEED